MPNRNLTPKTVFLEDKKAVEGHHWLLDNPNFERAIRVGMAEYTRFLTATSDMKDPQEASSRHFCLLGAQQFVHCLLNLAEKYDVPKIVREDNLDHKA